MNEQADAYIHYIGTMRDFDKPKMPKFDVSAYTENEYVRAITTIENEFEYTDSFDLTIDYLKGN